MEVKITISDAASASAPQLSVAGADVASMPPDAAAQAANSMPGIDAGPAPAALAAAASIAASSGMATGSAADPAQGLSAGAAPVL